MKVGLIGEKLGHSFSKEIHEQLTDYCYELIELDEEAFHRFMVEKPFDAINVTIPYKQKVIPYLDEICDQASRIGAVNAIKNVNGRLMGTNTDYDGLKLMIEKHFDLSDEVVAICGSGATSKTAYVVVSDLHPKEIIQVSRRQRDAYINYTSLKKRTDVTYIINTTSVGMYPDINKSIVDVQDFPNLKGVIDVVYNPLCTSLCYDARKKGVKAISGLEMLVGQAIVAISFFLDQSMDLSLIETITNQLITKKQNKLYYKKGNEVYDFEIKQKEDVVTALKLHHSNILISCPLSKQEEKQLALNGERIL